MAKSDYYSKRKVGVALMSALIDLGWKPGGFKEDQSDSMTYYYDPASWDGGHAKHPDHPGVVIVWNAYGPADPPKKAETQTIPCRACQGTGTYQEDGPMYRYLIPGGLSEPVREYNKGDQCKNCKGVGTHQVHVYIPTGEPAPYAHGTPKGKTWHVERDGQVIAAGVGYVYEMNDYGPKAGINEKNAKDLAARIVASATGRGQAAAGGSLPSLVGSATMSLNEEKNGVEVRFPAKPEPSVLESLKGAGFRWSRFSSCWWAKQTPATLAVARAITGARDEDPEEASHPWVAETLAQHTA